MESNDDEGNGIFVRPIQMALDEAWEQGILPRRYELVCKHENALPKGTAFDDKVGFREVVNKGVLCIIGATSSDMGAVCGPLANELKVPLVSWCGTERFAGEYCFRLGNGDCGGDPALIAHWVKKNGYKRIALLSEISPNGEEYFRFFRQECRRRGLTIAAVETVTQTPRDLAQNLQNLKDAGCDCLVYLGYGWLLASNQMRPALEKIKWDPPRITTTAFMFYLQGFSNFEGWWGIDQYCPDNPRAEGFHKRYVARYKEEPFLWPNAIPLLAYDSGVAVAEALHRAPILTPEGVKEGFERLRFIPTATGGPRTHMAAAPHDHCLFKGDWLHYAKIEKGKLVYGGLFEPAD